MILAYSRRLNDNEEASANEVYGVGHGGSEKEQGLRDFKGFPFSSRGKERDK